jgi:acetyl esterase
MDQSIFRSAGFLGQLLGPASLPRDLADMRAMLEGFAPYLNQGAPAAGEVHRGVLLREVAGTPVLTDLVVPSTPGPHPVLVYLHGGGWVCGSPRTHDKLAHRFAEAGFLVVNVDYRLAPEDPFPAGLEDALFAVRWAAREAERYGGDPNRLAIGGDSAGGNLAAATAVAMAEDPSAPRLSATLLLYGVFDFAGLVHGFEGDDPLSRVGREMVELMVAAYLGPRPPASLLEDPRVSPLRSAERLPPTFVVVGGADPLVEQARALTGILEKAGVPHEHLLVDGMPHGFVQMEFFPQARESIDRMVAFLRRHLPAP